MESQLNATVPGLMPLSSLMPNYRRLRGLYLYVFHTVSVNLKLYRSDLYTVIVAHDINAT